MVNKNFTGLSVKFRFLLPLLVGVIMAVGIVTFFSIRNSILDIYNSLELRLRQNVYMLERMFERERTLKLETVKTNLAIAHDYFYSSPLMVGKEKIPIAAINQFTGKVHNTTIHQWIYDAMPLYGNNTFVNKMQSLFGGTITIFQRIDSGYVRISTNVLTEKGLPAVGTFIPRTSPVVAAIERNETYYGRAYVVNDWYITAYEPIVVDGVLLGILYVGGKEKELDALQQIINKITIGNSGFLFVFDEQGNIVLKPERNIPYPDTKAIITRCKEAKDTLLMFREGGIKKMIACSFYDDFKLFLAAAIYPKAETEKLQRNIIKNTVTIALIIILVFFLFVYFVTTEKVYAYMQTLEAANEKLLAARNALAQSEKLATMGQLSAGIAHEVSNPLGVISIHAHILKEEVNKHSAIYPDIELIAMEADRCKNILSGLLNFARSSKVFIRENNAEEFMRILVHDIECPTGITITTENKVNNNVLLADTRQLLQALKNILVNSIEAMSSRGNIHVCMQTQSS